MSFWTLLFSKMSAFPASCYESPNGFKSYAVSYCYVWAFSSWTWHLDISKCCQSGWLWLMILKFLSVWWLQRYAEYLTTHLLHASALHLSSIPFCSWCNSLYGDTFLILIWVSTYIAFFVQNQQHETTSPCFSCKLISKAPKIYFYIKHFFPALVWFSIQSVHHVFKHGKIKYGYLMDKAIRSSVADFDRDFLKNN